MHSHLAIIGKNGELALKPDTSLNVTEKNPMFNDVEMFSQPIELPYDKNRHIIKNMDDVNSTLRATDVEGDQYGFYMDGIHIRHAVMKVQEDVVMNGSLSVNFDATNRTFKDMIADMRCRDVEIPEDILIGEKIGDVNVKVNYIEILRPYVSCYQDPGYVKGYEIKMKPTVLDEVFQPFALGYSFPGECYENASHEADPATDSNLATKIYPNPNKDATGNITVKVPRVKTSYINTSQPYPAAKYCNSRIAYAHHKVEMENEQSTGETSDEIVPASDRKREIQEDKSPYWVLDANRPASGLCFYVAYFLECLFKKLGVAYDMTALTSIEDFNYLAFFSTQCHYDARPKGDVTLSSEEQVNNWLESRGCGGKIRLEDNRPDEYSMLDKGIRKITLNAGEWDSWRVIGDHGLNNRLVSTDLTDGQGNIKINYDWGTGAASNFIVPNSLEPEYYFDCFRSYEVSVNSMTATVMNMYANSDNWPDVNVTEVIESLENSFGVRFCYDAEINKVTVKLLRDMFRDQQPPIHFKGKVLSMKKKTEKITGIRMKYSAESDEQEQRDYIRYGKRDYDTVYDYCDYPQGYTKFASYDEVTNNIDVGNRTGYCDMQTGDFFRIKVSSDASTTTELRPAVFEVGQNKGVEIGDCSKENEDYIKEFVSSFEPIQVNDVAYRGKNYAEQEDPLLVPFVDEDMEHEFLVKKILNPVSTKWGSIDIVYELCMAECYDPTQTDDGQSPLQHHDWGLTIGFLRPGSGTEDVVEYDRGYDHFDNSKWLITSKDYTMNADTFDEHGNFLGTNPQTSFSLKPRAWKPFRYRYVNDELQISTDPKQWENDPSWLIPCIEDERDAQTGLITKRIRSRGMCDTWMIEFFEFLLNRQTYQVEALCTAAELADIPNKWLRKWEIDGKVGLLNQVQYEANVENGLGKVELEFFAL